jgi:arylsulfatase A-like enzyme
MPARNALVIAVDGLRASSLGAYGNTWHGTPALDQLASHSVVHDWMWVTSPFLADFYRAAWHGGPPLAEQLAAAGVVASLATDEPLLSADDGKAFAEHCLLEAAGPSAAESTEDTAMAGLFALAAQQIRATGDAAAEHPERAAPRLWWVHARGLHGPWDAPLAYREALLEEGDPAAPTFVAPAVRAQAVDDDELLLDRVAYAAQAMVLDVCLGGLLAALAESRLDDSTLVVLVGCRGYALGEHGQVGGDSLYSELLHVPCLVRTPGRALVPPPRSSAFAQPGDLHATLCNWFGVARPSSPTPGLDLAAVGEASADATRQFVAARGVDGECALRTPAWMVRQPPQMAPDARQTAVELYAKPDDRWESNEVARLCPDVAARLQAALHRWHSSPGANEFQPLDLDLIVPSP